VSAVARSLFYVRRQASELWGLLAAIAAATLLGMGRLSLSTLWTGDILAISGLALFTAALARSVLREFSRSPLAGSAAGEDIHELEFGFLLVVGTYTLIALTGGPRSFAYPMVYALVSFLAIVHQRRRTVVFWLMGAAGCELLLSYAYGGSMARMALHLTWIGFFAAGNLLILSSLSRRLRNAHQRAMHAEIDRVRQEARDFRLIASQLPLASRAERTRDEEELRMAHGAVHAVHEQLYFTIDLLCSSLGLHTCALLWIRNSSEDAGGRRSANLIIKEMATASEFVRDSPELESPGILASVVRDPKALRLKSLGGRRVPPYYAGPEKVTDLCVVPLMDGAVVRGFLCADRIDDQPFEDGEEGVLQKAADQILRIVEQERSFAAVERGKYEQEQFYAASELLNEALTVEDVHAKTFAAVARIAPYDLAVITGYDAHAQKHEVLAVRLAPDAADDRAWGSLPSRLHDLVFDDGPSLVSIAVKNRHYMPAHGEVGESEVVVFDKSTMLSEARSLLVLPLVRGDQVQGTLVLASRRQSAYGVDAREMLRVIGHQVGVSMQNARMYKSMEERATTDGLTGLTNRRCFQERLEQLHALCERTGQKYSVILTDVDHFKGVNDTYGHPAGDAVLRRVAATFAGRARKVDIVARYGGEEFVLVLPDTDGKGAELFANRLREEIGAQTMNSDHGSFSVTISMGIAEFPLDSNNRMEMIDKADQALYWSKEHGRNRVTRAATIG
jgi:diguanylate cyclase (GGDEF)-like protein